MNDLSLLERIEAIIKLIVSSPFTIILLVLTILTIILLLLNQKLKKPVFKLILGGVYLIISIFIIVKYGTYFLKVGDTFIDQLFTIIYFPSMITYIASILIVLILMIMSFISNKISKVFKIASTLTFTLLLFFFVLVIDTINKNNIVITDKVNMYSNESLIVLIQASMSIFMIWIFILILNVLTKAISKKIDQSVEKEHEDIKLIEEDFKPISNEEYNESLNKYKQSKTKILFKELTKDFFK